MIRLLLQKQSDLGLHCLSRCVWQATRLSVRSLKAFTVYIITQYFMSLLYLGLIKISILNKWSGREIILIKTSTLMGPYAGNLLK